MGIKKIATTIIIIIFLLAPAAKLFAQNGNAVYFKWGTKPNRDKFNQNIVAHAINKNLTVALTDSTEEKWETGLSSMELIQYRSPFTDVRVSYAFNLIDKRSISFQQTLLQTIYSLYPTAYAKKMKAIFLHTTDSKVLAISAEYLYRLKEIKAREIKKIATKLNPDYENLDVTLKMLVDSKQKSTVKDWSKMLQAILNKKFLQGNTIVYSFQRKNRDYVGVAIIRNSKGDFMRDKNKKIIAIPQFARSLSNLPFYLSSGNTPQGVYRMHGTDISQSSFIGPTPNIQLAMPYELSVSDFLKNPSLKDSSWNEAEYKKLLPLSWQDYFPIYQTYYAGKIGRTEIIAHGTTMDPQYYKTKIYYPYTPTEGCLCTKEIWSENDGKRVVSDQQTLINTLRASGNVNGYYIVIEIDDQKKPVSVKELLPYVYIKK